MSRHVGWQVTLVKTRIDPEDTPEYQDHLEGQAQRQMLVTSSPSYRYCHYRRELSILPLQKRRPVYTPTLASSSQPTANTPCPWRASPWVRPSATLTKQCYLPWIDLVLITFSRGNIIATSIFSRTVVFISTFSSIKMELFLKQGGVIPSILCTRWDCIIYPALDQNLLRSRCTR